MRRTYRSKKDTGGALDHRDVVQNMDEKSSAFDAFYIQNLKQTKRELSCISSSNNIGVASKVRKRKYVKRIVKAVEPVRKRETMSASAYLTPDKSIRVNKVLDPFDLLLNSSVSSPACPVAPKAIKDTYEKLLPKKENSNYTRKKITRKKIPKVKKFNYSSTDSNCTESDKEKATNTQSNITDIRAHELLVEREPRKSPKYLLDESINRIVNNISITNNFKQICSNDSFNNSYKYRNSFANIRSPILQKSPLCSTPFKEKYRGMSIFKFSPITQNEQAVSPNCDSILEEKDECNDSKVDKVVGLEVFKEYQATPIIHLPNVSIEYKSHLSINEKEDNSNAVRHDDISQIQTEHINNEIKNDNSISNTGESSFQTTETETFLGFSNRNPEYYKISLQKNEPIQEGNIVCNEKESETSKSDVDNAENVSHSLSIVSNECTISQSSIDYQNSDKESMYDTCNSEQSSSDDDYKGNKEPLVVIERMNHSSFMKYYEKMLAESEDEEISKETDNIDFESLANKLNEEVINHSLSTESDYVETNSKVIVITDSSTTEEIRSSNEEDTDNEEDDCVSFVTTRRRNEITDSMFIFDHSYGSISTACDNTVLSNFKNNLERSDVNISVHNTSEHNFDEVDTNEEQYVDEDLNLTDNPVVETASRIVPRKSSTLPRKSAAMSTANRIYDSKLIDSPSDKITSRRSTRNSSRLPKRSYFASLEPNTSKHKITLIGTNDSDDGDSDKENYVNEDLNLTDNPVVETASRIVPRKSSTLPRKSVAMSTANLIYDSKLTDSPSDKIISRRTTRKSLRLPRRSYFSSSEPDTSKVEINFRDNNDSDDVETDEENYLYEDSNLTDSPNDQTILRIDTKRSILPRNSNAISPANSNYDSKFIDSPSDERISSITTRKISKLPRGKNFSSSEPDTSKYEINLIDTNDSDDIETVEENYLYKDSNLTDIPNDETSLRIDTKSSILPRNSNAKSPAKLNYDSKFTDSPSHERISRITTRKSSKIPRGSHSSNLESDSCKYENTLKYTNEVNNKIVVEKGAIETDSNYLERSDAKTPLISGNSSWSLHESSIVNHHERSSYTCTEVKPSIVLQPGKKWERSLSIYRRMTMAADHFDQSILDDECKQKKGRKYRQSVISTMEMQECRDSLHNDSINSRRSTFVSKPSRPTIRFVKDPNISRVSINTSTAFDDLKGFLNEECDDTVIELSKLSIANSEHEVTILDNFHETERVATARDYVLRRCNQTEPILFDECYPETVLKNCHKIGEGVYGEVFLWRGRDGRARVMKIVPIAGNIKVNGEDQKDFHEIISEIVIAMELSALRAPIADFERQLDEGNNIDALDLQAIPNATDTFNEVLAVRCVQGPYPSRLLDLWELFDECKGSENDSPGALPSHQHYLVLELANAGQDLESFQFTNAHQAYALFHQIAFGLAVGEESFQFEHRDLHWGNVLIAPTEQTVATFILRGRVYRIPRCGVAATIIDYSLSRLTLPLAADSAALYNDLATDEQLFDAVGDYQFEVYRLMRDKVGNDWKNFEPYTNILWLHYIVDKMITALRYKRTNTKIHKQYIEKLKGIKNRILEYGSAVQYVLTDIEF